MARFARKIERLMVATVTGEAAEAEKRKLQPRHPEKAHRPDQTGAERPAWIRVKAPGGAEWDATRAIVKEHRLVTVCEEAGCPNIGECWAKKHATFMILGDVCTRACAFCNVRTGLPQALDPSEPSRVAHAVAALARVAKNGTPAEKAKVRADVARKFPDLPSSKGKGKSQAAANTQRTNRRAGKSK